MCGRYTLATPAGELVEAFDVPAVDFEWLPRYNVAPGQDVPVVARDRRGRRMGLMRWGLVSPRPGGTDAVHVNARGEAAARTPTFRDAFRRRRCLVPASGFYEWQRQAGAKVPFHFRPVAGGVLALAAVWGRWVAPGGEPASGFALLTVDAGPDVAPVHHRMPVVVPPADFALWLDASAPLQEVQRLVRPLPGGALHAQAVSPRVNSVSHDDAGLVDPV